MSQSAER